MELIYASLSPFGRKVLAVAHEIGIANRIKLTPVSSRNEPEKIAPFNPLGKIPVLISDTGAVLYDSAVICEFLNAEYGNHRLLPASGFRRWEILTHAALADGLLEAGVQVRYERARPAAEQSVSETARQLTKVTQGLDQMERVVEQFGADLDLAQIGLACALGYIPLRVEEFTGLKNWPKLAAWYARACQRESLAKTAPQG